MRILTTTSSFGNHITPDDTELIRNPLHRRLTESEAESIINELKPDAIIAGLEPLTEKVISNKPYLKIISRCGVGMDNVDLNYAAANGIKVFNTPNAPVESVAEMTVALILTLIKKINISDAIMRNGGWKGPKGNMLRGKTVGIIGCGRIGTRVADILHAFGSKLIGYDTNGVNSRVIMSTGLDQLISEADIVCLHVPYIADTVNIIDSRILALMKKTALLINTARGGLIDEKALYNALKNNEIGGAALDCFMVEPYIGPLKELDNIILSPHMASSAVESRYIMEKEALENILNNIGRK